MIKLDIRADMAHVKRQLRLTERQLSFAVGKAATQTAFDCRDAWADHVKLMIDRPKAMTVKSALVNKARRDKLSAEVFIRDEASKGTPPVKYLAAQMEGRQRRHKRFEKALIRAGAMAASEYAVPGSGARMDRYGNVTAGQITQILSAIRANPDPLQNKSKRSGRALRPYFLSRGGGLARGVWRRRSRGQVEPVLLFTTNQPSYARRLMFAPVMKRQALKSWPRRFVAAARSELARAKALSG